MSLSNWPVVAEGPMGGMARTRAVLPVLESRVVAAAAWDGAVAGFDGVCQEQLVAYAGLRWPGVQLEPVLFAQDGKTVGGALVMIQQLPLGVSSIALVKWGPILADSGAGNAGDLVERMVETLVKTYAVGRKMMVSIMPRAEVGETNRLEDILVRRGFKPGVGVRYPDRFYVKVGMEDAQRLAAFGQKWRYNLRKSLRAGLNFEIGSAEDLPRFMDLYQAMSERKQFPDFSGIDTLESMMALPEDGGRPSLFFVNHGGRTVAGAVIFASGDTACYLYGATDDAALGLRAGYFLHWHIIGWLRDNSAARYYDLGGTDGFAGLHQFKSGMVGEGGQITPLPPAMNYASHWLPYALGTSAYRARELVNRTRDKMLGARLAMLRRRQKAKG